jgi:GntR family transcriptional regulator/MocR family aminotransferase
MLYDFIIADKNAKEPMYRQIYISIRNAIESSNLKLNTKLPSIRKLSAELGVSKTTITAAYDQLCAEGYIKTKPQSGYYVAAEFTDKPKAFDEEENNSKSENTVYKYDFSSKSIDESIINLTEWKKSIKDVINRNYLLTSYGDVQGEKALRLALQKYALGTRSVNSVADNIVVGAGTQAILYILCSILGCGKKVAMAENSFVQSEFIFKSFDYKICYFESDKNGASVESLEKLKPDIVLLNPNFTEPYGANMPVTRRLEIINWSKRSNALIIEDDYNGELRYSTHPMPCVQNYDNENTVYIGSFSKVLLPSVRISYMVLPEKLMKKYLKIKAYTNQTASKTEQLALAGYINTGKIDIHLRKARRVYLEKSKIILKSIAKYFDGCKIEFNETSLYVKIKLNKELNWKTTERELEEKSIKIMPYKSFSDEFGLSFSGIQNERIDDGIRLISEIIN